MNASISQVNLSRMQEAAYLDEQVAALTIGTLRDRANTIDLRFATRTRQSPKRWVVFLNGRTEWIEKYAYLPDVLDLPADTGFLTWDHRGQGASGGARSYVRDYKDFADDAAEILKSVVQDAPYVLIGHSMGGLIALHATLTGAAAPQKLVLCSPLLGLPEKPVPSVLAKPIARLLTTCRLGPVSSGAGSFVNIPFEANVLTHDVFLYRRMQNSPYKIPGATFAWVDATFKALGTCFSERNLSRLNVPTLILGGTDERVVDAKAFQVWVSAASKHASRDVQLRLIPGARHELLSEIPVHFAATLAEIRAWTC